MASGVGAKRGVKAGDSKQLRKLDHAAAWAFGVAKDIPQGTITRSWVANFIKRGETFVKTHWNKSPYEILSEEIEKEHDGVDNDGILSQESRELIREMLRRPRKKSVREIINEVQRARRKSRSYGTVYRFLKEEKCRAFHIISKPRISVTSMCNRLDFCEFLKDWDENDFLFLAPSDEFFIYSERKPNHQNDRIWAYSIDDIPDSERIVP